LFLPVFCLGTAMHLHCMNPNARMHPARTHRITIITDIPPNFKFCVKKNDQAAPTLVFSPLARSKNLGIH
ncbi:MAG: hypothetical protein VCA36_10545, partial [Opitutales bacterium]